MLLLLNKVPIKPDLASAPESSWGSRLASGGNPAIIASRCSPQTIPALGQTRLPYASQIMRSIISTGLTKHPIGVILLARLAVDRNERGAGLGKTLLVDALSRALTAADAIGARAILVHAIDDEAIAFYKKFGFEPSPLIQNNSC